MSEQRRFEVGDTIRVRIPPVPGSARTRGQRLVLEVWANRTDKTKAPYIVAVDPKTATFHFVRPDWVLGGRKAE